LKVGVALKFNRKQGNQLNTSDSAQQRNVRPANNAQIGGESYELMILKLAKENKGILTVSDVALGAEISMEEAKRQLDDFVAKGFAELRTRRNGSQAYIIPDFLEGLPEGF
jgi:Fic family protein